MSTSAKPLPPLPTVRQLAPHRWLVTSRTTSSLVYCVSDDDRGYLQCTCPASTYHRGCWHVREVAALVRAQQLQQDQQTQTKPQIKTA